MSTHGRDVRIITFGGVNAAFSDGTIAKLQTNRARALLLYLTLCRGRLVHREEICVALWPDATEREARAQLRKSLWRVKSALLHPTAQGDGILQCAEDHVGMTTARIWSDIWEFEDALAGLDSHRSDQSMPDRIERLIAAIDLQSGTFAAGIFDAWCVDRQRSHDRARITAIERIVDHYADQQQWVQAIHWAQRGLELDPMVEYLHRVIMACHMSMGDRASALRQYLTCEEVLREGLAISPSDKTQALAHQISGPGAAPAPCDQWQNGPSAKSLTAVRDRLAHYRGRVAHSGKIPGEAEPTERAQKAL